MLTPAARIAALTAELAETQDAEAALRTALLDLLIQMPGQLLTTPEDSGEGH